MFYHPPTPFKDLLLRSAVDWGTLLVSVLVLVLFDNRGTRGARWGGRVP
jgi:hypothetical protein